MTWITLLAWHPMLLFHIMCPYSLYDVISIPKLFCVSISFFMPKFACHLDPCANPLLYIGVGIKP